MAYSEQYVVPFPAGIHYGTISAFLAHLQPGMVTINGLDPTDRSSVDQLAKIGQGDTVEIAAETGDPQRDRDAVHIAQGLIAQGRDPWQKPGQPMNLPIERYNQGANFMRRNVLQLPEEPGGGIPPTTASKWRLTADVSSDMSVEVTSKWKVVALGELQQPGGVGETQDYNPVVDGPNPEGPEIDNAGNSPEQEVAMQTWINMAVDGLNRGEDPQAILAQLAHDGCPSPEEVLMRAKQQPMEEQEPVSDSIGQDPFQAPPPADQTGSMESVSQQPSVLASTKIARDCPACGAHMAVNDNGKEYCTDTTCEYHGNKNSRVRIAGTNATGTEIDRWEGIWGEGQVKIALDEGGTMTVSPDQVTPLETETGTHPVTEIQQFIDNMPPVEPSRPHIEARLANLETVRRAVRSTISKQSLTDQAILAEMDKTATEESALLKEALTNLVENYEVNYFAEQPKFAYNAFDVATPEITAWAGRPKEAGAIWATENFTGATDETNFKQAAAHYASNLGLTGSQFEEFLAGAEEVTSEQNPFAEAADPELAEIVIDHEGPAEALFLS